MSTVWSKKRKIASRVESAKSLAKSRRPAGSNFGRGIAVPRTTKAQEILEILVKGKPKVRAGGRETVIVEGGH